MRLIDADVIVEEICMGQCRRHHKDCDCDCEMVSPITNAQRIDVEPVMKWISVKDRLPEDEYECLVIDKSGYYWIGWFKGDEERWVIDGTICGDGYVTHWIPLPEPPKEDNDAAD